MRKLHGRRGKQEPSGATASSDGRGRASSWRTSLLRKALSQNSGMPTIGLPSASTASASEAGAPRVSGTSQSGRYSLWSLKFCHVTSQARTLLVVRRVLDVLLAGHDSGAGNVERLVESIVLLLEGAALLLRRGME